MASVTLTQLDNGKSVEAAVGDLVIIRLPENPTTGFRWAVEKMEEQTLALQNMDFSLPPSTGVGGGGEKTLVFQAKRADAARIQLKLWREWEGDRSISKRYSVTVHVRNS